MSATELLELINHLPADKKKVVEDLVANLTSGSESSEIDIPQNNKGESKVKFDRGYGSLKGRLTFLTDDFDAPLEDFKDYM